MKKTSNVFGDLLCLLADVYLASYIFRYAAFVVNVVDLQFFFWSISQKLYKKRAKARSLQGGPITTG